MCDYRAHTWPQQTSIQTRSCGFGPEKAELRGPGSPDPQEVGGVPCMT